MPLKQSLSTARKIPFLDQIMTFADLSFTEGHAESSVSGSALELSWTSKSPGAPCMKIVPLGPNVCKQGLLWAILSPRESPKSKTRYPRIESIGSTAPNSWTLYCLYSPLFLAGGRSRRVRCVLRLTWGLE